MLVSIDVSRNKNNRREGIFTAKMCKILSNVGGLILGYIEADLGEYSLIIKSFCSLFKFYKICAFV